VITAEPPASASAWSAWSLATRPPDLGLGTSAVRERTARDEASAQASSEGNNGRAGGLRDALEADDRAKGLGAGGPVVQAARDATAQSLAPVNGYAVFEATFDPSGKITSVRVLDTSADRPSWEDVAGAIQGTLREKAIKVPPRSTGLAVSVRVESRWQMPDGSDPDPPKICVPPFPCNAAPHRKKIVLNPLLLTAPLPAVGDKPLRVVHVFVVRERTL
jgi:hypothetical protein